MSTIIPKEKLEALGLYIRSKRISKGYGLLEFSKLLDISGAYLSTLEGGRHPKVNPLLLTKIANILNIDYLILYKIVGYSHITMDELHNQMHSIPDNNVNELVRLGTSLNGKELELVLKYIEFIKDNK